MYIVCEEHVDWALDDFVDEYEDAPDVVDLEKVQFSDWQPPAHCSECERKPRYLIV